MTSVEDDFLGAIVPLLKLISLTLIGLLLAHPKTQIVPKDTFKLLSKLVFALFLPCLIFTHLGKSITLANILQWWFIPINVLISTALGCILGILVVIICRPPPQFMRFTVIMTAFGNTGNLPIAIIGSVCHSEENLFGRDCKQNGVAYVSFAQWVAVILVYTFVYHMMEPPLEYYEIVGEDGFEAPCDEASNSLLVEAEWPSIDDRDIENPKTPLIAITFNTSSSVSEPAFPNVEQVLERSCSPKPIGCLATARVVRKIKIVAEKTPIWNILQPPTIASLLAIMVGLVPGIKDFVFGYDAPLSFFSDSLEILAGAMVPCVMLILGGMLAEGPDDSKLGVRTTIGIIVARLLVLPLVGIGVVVLASKLHLVVDGDEMYKFVLALQYTTPSAVLLGAIASLRGYAVRESCSLLFWQNLLALFSLSFYIVLYFHLLF